MAAINKLGVIGAGLMGNGIAHVAALSGIPVVLMDVQQQALDRALATMAKNMDRQVSKGSVSGADRDAALARIVTATDNSAFADCDMVIEAATENEEIKKKIFAALCPVLKPDAFWRPTHHLFPSHGWRRRPIGRAASSACISSTPCR